jgi:arsenate reductase
MHQCKIKSGLGGFTKTIQIRHINRERHVISWDFVRLKELVMLVAWPSLKVNPLFHDLILSFTKKLGFTKSIQNLNNLIPPFVYSNVGGNTMIRVLFICIHNSARSQMAEAFLNRLGNGKFIAESAGLEAGTLNPIAVKAMAELGYDIGSNKTKSVFDFFQQGKRYEIVVKVCDALNGQRCPIFPSTKVSLNWDLTDPSSLPGTPEEKLNAIRPIRDLIKIKVEALIKDYESMKLI